MLIQVFKMLNIMIIGTCPMEHNLFEQGNKKQRGLKRRQGLYGLMMHVIRKQHNTLSQMLDSRKRARGGR